MRLRQGLCIGAATAAVITACSNHYDLVTADAGVDAGQASDVDSATPISDAATSVADGSSPDLDGGPLAPAAIGEGCNVSRVPTPSYCQDFEGTVDSATLISTDNGTLTVISPGSNSPKGLQMTCVDGDLLSGADYITRLDKAYTHVTWTFDLRMDANVIKGTFVAALALDGITKDPDTDCELEVSWTDPGFYVSEFCSSAQDGNFGSPVVSVATPALPQSAVWWNMLVDVDLTAKSLRLAIRTDATSIPVTGSGTFDTSVPTDEEVIITGPFTSEGTTPNSALEIDNLVEYWQ